MKESASTPLLGKSITKRIAPVQESMIDCALCTDKQLDIRYGRRKHDYTEARANVLDIIDLDGGPEAIEKRSKERLGYAIKGHAVRDGDAIAFYNSAIKYKRTDPDGWGEIKETLRESILENNGSINEANNILAQDMKQRTGQNVWDIKTLQAAFATPSMSRI